MKSTDQDFSTILTQAIETLDRMERRESAATLSRWLREKFDTKETQKVSQAYARPHGVSIVTPTYCGAHRIGRLLDSITRQTLQRRLFEIIVVTNGPDDGTVNVLSTFIARHPDIRLVHKHCDVSSAAAARNVGIDAITMRYFTFIDDDDYVSDQFLEVLLKNAAINRIVLSSISDFDGDNASPSRVGLDALAAVNGHPGNSAKNLYDVRGNLSMTCAKLAPTSLIQDTRFPDALRSGEDVVFWTNICLKNITEIYVPEEFDKAIYHREVRAGSVSRREGQFDFSVKERLEVIRAIELIEEGLELKTLHTHGQFISSRFDGQAGFIIKYLSQRRDEYGRFVEEAVAIGVRQTILDKVANAVANKAVISYCFPPSVDASSIVMMKRILAEAAPVHVISNKMEAVRRTSEPLKAAMNGYLASHIELNTPVSWGDFSKTRQFIERAANITQELIEKRRIGSIYTRSLWAPSTFAGALVKMTNPQIHWAAEFSDPNLLDIHGKERSSAIPRSWLREMGILSHRSLSGLSSGLTSSENMFLWAELLPFVLADELIFTNYLQLEYMTSQKWAEGISGLVREKAVVRPQPTLKATYYSIGRSPLHLPENKIQIGYFGSLYATRGIAELLQVIAGLDPAIREKVALHIVSPESAAAGDEIARLGIGDAAFAHESIEYFDCLAAYASFDYLMVNDANTLGIKSVNPYLPSKFSDYLGAERPIWAIVEPGSTLSKQQFPPGSIVSELGKASDYAKAFREISRSRS